MKVHAAGLIAVLLTIQIGCVPVLSLVRSYINWSQSLYPYISSEPIYANDFSVSDGHWTLGAFVSKRFFLANGYYVIQSEGTNDEAYSILKRSEPYKDVAILVSISNHTVSGEKGAVGVVCRYQDPGNYYMFILGGQRKFAILRFLDGDSEQIVRWRSAEADFWDGKDPINLVVVCDGNHLLMGINGEILAEVIDPYLEFGAVGLHSYVWIEDPVTFILIK